MSPAAIADTNALYRLLNPGLTGLTGLTGHEAQRETGLGQSDDL
ncbi:hypothetical protein STAN_2932 [Streptomyces sp. CBMAI 2042]|nr:hypothetical protein [Streptomyces sp. CBMAI 2042]RLV67408.1 hypothetical protein STAN_2932 [Streptomyces sp. CBMAI 2042]